MDPWPVGQEGEAPTVLLTSGASCPDATVDRVMRAILDRYPGSKDVEDVLIAFEQELDAQPLS